MKPSRGADQWVIRLAETTFASRASPVHSGIAYVPLSFMLGVRESKGRTITEGGTKAFLTRIQILLCTNWANWAGSQFIQIHRLPGTTRLDQTQSPAGLQQWAESEIPVEGLRPVL